MLELAIAHSLAVTQVTQKSIHVPVQGGQRYCPVFNTRGQPAQYLDFKHDNKALVAEDEDFLAEFIEEALGGVVPEPQLAVKNAVAFSNVTTKVLPSRYYMTGEVVVWDGHYIEQTHPARRHCGEGPFLIVHEESYIAQFSSGKGPLLSTRPKLGNDRLVLLNLRTRGMVIAHGGFFRERQSLPTLEYRQATGCRKHFFLSGGTL